MQLAPQNAFKDKKPARSKKDARAGTIAAIYITWKKLRPDLRHDPDELRESRLLFMSQVLNCDVKSSRQLSSSKLGKVLDAMRELQRAPLLPGAVLTPDRGVGSDEQNDCQSASAQIHHLATEAQAATIDKLFLYLRWSPEAIEGFLLKRFKTRSYRMVTPAQSNSLTMILLTIAASRDIKSRKKIERVSRAMIRAEIPALKQRLGIDQKPVEEVEQESDYEEDSDL